MMNDKQTKEILEWERGLSRISVDIQCIDEILDYEFKEERNWVAIRRNLIIALSITPVALIIESPMLFYVSYVFFALCWYSILKGILIQNKISELRQKVG